MVCSQPFLRLFRCNIRPCPPPTSRLAVPTRDFLWQTAVLHGHSRLLIQEKTLVSFVLFTASLRCWYRKEKKLNLLGYHACNHHGATTPSAEWSCCALVSVAVGFCLAVTSINLGAPSPHTHHSKMNIVRSALRVLRARPLFI